MNTSIEQIISLVDQAFANNIWSSSTETVLGLETEINGKDDFLKELRHELVQSQNYEPKQEEILEFHRMNPPTGWAVTSGRKFSSNDAALRAMAEYADLCRVKEVFVVVLSDQSGDTIQGVFSTSPNAVSFANALERKATEAVYVYQIQLDMPTSIQRTSLVFRG